MQNCQNYQHYFRNDIAQKSKLLSEKLESGIKNTVGQVVLELVIKLLFRSLTPSALDLL